MTQTTTTNGKPTNRKKKGTNPEFRFISSAKLAASKFTQSWLVEKFFVKGQPGVIGGAKKAMKTSLMIDMAISLGSGERFLSEFDVPRVQRVAVLSGESGQATILETAQRICDSKEIELSDCDVLWNFGLPKLDDHQSLQNLHESLKNDRVKVVFIDPLYLCLGKVSATNLYEVGPVLAKAARACLTAGATPILLHHANKPSGKQTKPMELNDLAFSGIGEFARQWMLISRREAYVPGMAKHRLFINAGGSAGHSARWNVDINENRVLEGNGERGWNVSVNTFDSGADQNESKSYYDD